MKQIKKDGWLNVLTGLGSRNKDRSLNYYYAADHVLDQTTLDALYRSNGFGKRIVDLPVNEMVRQWIEISGDPDNHIVGHMESIEAKSKIRDLLRWSRLYGGALAVIGADDGQELQEPLNEARIRSVDFLHVFDRHQIRWEQEHLYNDPRNRKYGTPELYTIRPYHNADSFLVHESRVLRIDGEQLPNRVRMRNNQWGDSVLQSIYTQLKDLGAVYGATTNIIEDFIQTILKIDNLSDLLASGQDDLIRRRLEIIDLSRSVCNTIILDSQENYQKQASSVAGLDALIDRFSLALAAVTGIPYSFLMGQPPSGLQSTGAADIRMFYDMIRSEQEDQLQPVLERLVRLIMISHNGPFRGRELDNWQIKFKPLWQLTDKEQADYRKVVAETDALYIDRGVIDPAEVAISRFGGHIYSAEIDIDVNARNTMVSPSNLEE